MSWNNIGAITEVAPGHSVTWEYSWENGQDMGLQLAGPNYPTSIIAPGNLATLVASNQGKQLLGFGKGGGAMVSYVVAITNTSNEFGFHNLQGGGVS
jgi:hypothetical protein